MANLMNKTKANLIEIIHEIKQKNDDFENRLNEQNRKNDELFKQLDAMKNDLNEIQKQKEFSDIEINQLQSKNVEFEDEINALRHKTGSLDREIEMKRNQIELLQEDNQTLRSALTEMESDIIGLTSELDAGKREKERISIKYSELEADYQEISERLAESEYQYHANQELFKSFIENDRQKIILIDTSYTVRYVNSAASCLLDFLGNQPVANHRIFDFMEYSDALKLKEKIDKAFLEGEKVKVKDIAFKNCQGDASKYKIKLMRVRYCDKPSIKMIFQ